MSLPEPAIIAQIIPQSSDTALFLIASTGKKRLAAADFLPGQFLQISLPGMGEIPISYCGLPQPDGTIELCVKNVGHVTAALHNASIGAAVAVRGPFGQGFPLEKMLEHDLVLIAGGLGIAPIRSLLSVVLQSRSDYGAVTLLYGVRSPDLFLFHGELTALAARSDMRLMLCAEHVGTCPAAFPYCKVAMLPALVQQTDITSDTLAALCGPPAAYPFILKELRNYSLPDENIYLSLERRMQCGIGRCAHCAVGTLLCCRNGPVFSAAQLRGIEGAL